MPVGLYIHVPFCKSKCPYCDFYSLFYTLDKAKIYTDVLILNLEHYKGESINSIYFGGGTPSLLPIECFEKIMSFIAKKFKLVNPEITLEANPKTISFDKLKDLVSLGFNRISFGVQSCNDAELLSLGRIHSAKDAVNSISQAYNAGFDNISTDVMLGIIGMTDKSLSCTLNTLTNLPITHISAYLLKIEPDTLFNNKSIISSLPSEDDTCDFYLHTIDILMQKGFYQYEISNFSKEGYESRHNLKYWHCEEYIGIGPSAHSFYHGKRYKVPRDINDFISKNRQTEIVTEAHPHTFEETAMLCLRLTEGLSRSSTQYFNVDFDNLLKKAQPLAAHNLANISNDNISLTPQGFLVSNEIIARLII